MALLYLASSSVTRQSLLKESLIPFKVITQLADESKADWTLSIDELVLSISILKMDFADMPKGKEGEISFVLTADTLAKDSCGVIHGKPKNYDDAVRKIRALRGISYVSTGFCLDRKSFKNNHWTTQKRISKTISSACNFEVPDDWIDRYIENSPALSIAGAITIEGFGAQFLKSINGSYSAILGLPMFEVRHTLEDLGFFS